MCCIDPFIKAWLGNDYILPLSVIVSFAFYIYSDSIRRSITIYKEAAGICKEDKNTYLEDKFDDVKEINIDKDQSKKLYNIRILRFNIKSIKC